MQFPAVDGKKYQIGIRQGFPDFFLHQFVKSITLFQIPRGIVNIKSREMRLHHSHINVPGHTFHFVHNGFPLAEQEVE